MTDITEHTVFQQNPEVVSNQFDDATVMMDSDFENYFGFKEIGSRIWSLLEQQQTPLSICTKLTQEYNVDKDQCLADIMPFLADLKKHGLIETK